MDSADRRLAIRKAAVKLIYEKGYRGFTMRGLAQAVGIKGASLYHHFPSKQAMLTWILVGIQDELTTLVRLAVSDAGALPTLQLPAAIRAHLRYHVDHRHEASISDSELRDLTPENRRRVVGLRDGYETIFRDIIRRGTEFNCWNAEPRLAGFIVMAMCTGVSTWYRADGPLSLEQIADYYTNFVVTALGGSGAGRRNRGGEGSVTILGARS